MYLQLVQSVTVPSFPLVTFLITFPTSAAVKKALWSTSSSPALPASAVSWILINHAFLNRPKKSLLLYGFIAQLASMVRCLREKWSISESV
ncbi:hypothetical protein ES703_108985 [subsurface metagenome]